MKTLEKRRLTTAKKSLATASAPTIDERKSLALVMELMAIPGLSGHEGKVAQCITDKLLAAGASKSAIRTDNAHKKTPLKGEVGNLVFQMPGTIKAPRRLLMAHMDTVPVCLGAEPIVRGNYVVSANSATGLGADDRGGVAVVLGAALEILKHKLPHPPLTFFWPIQEEVGLHGARHAQVSLLGKPKLAFNWDGGASEKLSIGATGGYRMKIVIEGLGSHAGNAPEKGISAIAVAGLAIAELVAGGWHGLIVKGSRRGTSNIGVIHGGLATNVVTDHVELKVEARSHDPKFRAEIVDHIEQAFKRAVKKIKSDTGAVGKVTIDGGLDYESFKLADDEPCVLAAEEAIRATGAEPARAVSNGGLDANWMTLHGIPTVTLGCGQENVHTVSERLDIPAFQRACRIALRLATECSQ